MPKINKDKYELTLMKHRRLAETHNTIYRSNTTNPKRFEHNQMARNHFAIASHLEKFPKVSIIHEQYSKGLIKKSLGMLKNPLIFSDLEGD